MRFMRTENPRVGGSNPPLGTIPISFRFIIKGLGKVGQSGIQWWDTIRSVPVPILPSRSLARFTYLAQRTRAGRVKGQRYTLRRRLREKAGLKNFRFHDI